MISPHHATIFSRISEAIFLSSGFLILYLPASCSMTSFESALRSIEAAQRSIAREIPRSAAVYSAILLVACQIYLCRFSFDTPLSSVMKIPHPEGPGFPRDPPSLYTMSFIPVFFTQIDKGLFSMIRERFSRVFVIVRFWKRCLIMIK